MDRVYTKWPTRLLFLLTIKLVAISNKSDYYSFCDKIGNIWFDLGFFPAVRSFVQDLTLPSRVYWIQIIEYFVLFWILSGVLILFCLLPTINMSSTSVLFTFSIQLEFYILKYVFRDVLFFGLAFNRNRSFVKLIQEKFIFLAINDKKIGFLKMLESL